MKKANSDIFIDENLALQTYYCIYAIQPDPNYFEQKNGEVWFRNAFVAKGVSEKKVRDFVLSESRNKENLKTIEEIKKWREEASRTSKEIEYKIRKLIRENVPHAPRFTFLRINLILT